jgi:alginate O-acetyltransferase complex protein AlgI
MAIGLGRMLGFEFLENFNYPYISRSITEFWRRWHISLGTWFRDYVYIPLGGNRFGLRRQLFNIFVVWALTGIWHGANWTFLFWGVYYAVFLVIEKAFLLKFMEKWPAALRNLYTLVIVMSGWVIFQLDQLSAVGVYLGAMFGFARGGFATGTDLYYLTSYAVTFIISIFSCTPAGKSLYNLLPEKARSIAAPMLVILGLILSTAYLVEETYNPFLYFRF